MGAGESTLSMEVNSLEQLLQTSGDVFPGSNHHPSDRKNWMADLGPQRLRINEIVWPGTHDSATNGIGEVVITRPIGECQDLSIYDQLVTGTRVLDIRIGSNRDIAHGVLRSYSIDVVLQDIKRFLTETSSEIIILEVRTEYGHEDAPNFQQYLVAELGQYLIHQDDGVFKKTVAELLPKRIICIWKPRNSPPPTASGPLWSAEYLQDDWANTDLPYTKFRHNLERLGNLAPVSTRRYFYRVEHTTTSQLASTRIKRYAKLFISRCVHEGLENRLQIFSSDFIEDSFVDACVGLTSARIN
ncbi:hypothetical protein ACHQM5_020975 [Ranunculus cassubicifolius]